MTITVQVEPYKDFIGDAKKLYPLHWEELALNKDKVPLDPMYELYDYLAEQDALLVVTLRQEGKLVGYFIGILRPHLHYRTCLTLTMDIFWTHPDIRGGMEGVRLFREVEREAKHRGAHRLYYGSKLHKDCSRLFEYLKMAPVETYYSKWIGD
jgi:L-amino acid N-acyltransferase YncA